MFTHLTAIGNSRGIRIPSAILKQCGFDDKVKLEVKNQSLIITPATPPRTGWEAALQQAAPSPLLIDDALDLGADEDWKW